MAGVARGFRGRRRVGGVFLGLQLGGGGVTKLVRSYKVQRRLVRVAEAWRGVCEGGRSLAMVCEGIESAEVI